MQVVSGVYLVNGSPYGRHQNGYLLHRNDATVLIDSGDLEDGETLPEVERNARRWGVRLEDTSHLLITHAHFDHASHAAELRRRGLLVVASRETAVAMEHGDRRCIGFAVGKTFEPCSTDIELADGEELVIGGLGIRCLAAPGHADGLVVYETMLDGERTWFTGDLFEAHHAHRGVSLPWRGDPNFDARRYTESLRRLLDLPPPEHLMPGHGPPAIGIGQRVLQRLYELAKAER